jgi:uncharacterized Zn finger protein
MNPRAPLRYAPGVAQRRIGDFFTALVCIIRTMPRPPALTRSAIQKLFDAKSFARGAAYALKGAICEPRWATGELSARCRGSSAGRYRVTVDFNASGKVTAARCSCPVDGWCKHAAALLLTWADHPDRFDERIPLDQQLADRSRDDLVMLIGQMLRQFPDAEALLETPPPSATAVVTPKQFQAQATAVFDRLLDSEDVNEIGDALVVIASTGDDFLALQNPRGAAAVYEGVLQEIDSRVAHDSHLFDALFTPKQCCLAGLRGCLRALKTDVKARRHIITLLLKALSDDLEGGGADGPDDAWDALIEDTTPPERADLIARVQQLARSAGDTWTASSYENLMNELAQRKD